MRLLVLFRGEVGLWHRWLSDHGECEKTTPNVGLEPTTLRLRVSCSTDWASRAFAACRDAVSSRQKRRTRQTANLLSARRSNVETLCLSTTLRSLCGPMRRSVWYRMRENTSWWSSEIRWNIQAGTAAPTWRHRGFKGTELACQVSGVSMCLEHFDNYWWKWLIFSCSLCSGCDRENMDSSPPFLPASITSK